MSEDSNYPLSCPIWGTMAAEVYCGRENGHGIIYDSPRAGGEFSILAQDTNSTTGSLLSMLEEIDTSVKARLTSWLIEQRRLGEKYPKVSYDSVENAKVRRPLNIIERADNFLRYLAQLEEILGGGFRAPYSRNSHENYLKALSYLELTEDHAKNTSTRQTSIQILTYLRYLNDKKWISLEMNSSKNVSMSTDFFHLTIDGYSRLEEINYTSSFSDQAFIAMWFDCSMNLARKSILSAIKNAGYEPLIIDQKHHINKIDDEIITEIRRSRFMVADFTQDKKGARGGVYYEAGFAHGLGIPVIFTCHEDCLENIHFDVRQYNCIIWKDKDLEKLQKDLTNRITAILGDGPVRP